MLRSVPANSGTASSAGGAGESSGRLLVIEPIASKWQNLASMDQRSPDFLPLFSSLITGAGYLSTTKLLDGSAKITLDALGEVGCLLANVKETLGQ